MFTGPARVCEGETSTKRVTETELQAELVKVNEVFVNEVCDHRETKAALVHKVNVLFTDLVTVKQTCKDQEYHMQKKEHEYQRRKRRSQRRRAAVARKSVRKSARKSTRKNVRRGKKRRQGGR
jgi:hypothetical protein